MGTKGSEVWWTVVDMSNRGRNKTEDVGGGRKAPKEGLMGYQRAIFPIVNCLFWLSFIILSGRSSDTQIFFDSFL